MPRTFACMIVAVAALMTGLECQMSAQVTPHFVVSVSPSIVTITQGGMASLTVTTVVNERPDFAFSLPGLPWTRWRQHHRSHGSARSENRHVQR